MLKGKGLPAAVKTVTKACLTFDVTVLATFTGAAGSASALGVTVGRAAATGDPGATGVGATGEAVGATGVGELTTAAGVGAAGETVGATGARGVAGAAVVGAAGAVMGAAAETGAAVGEVGTTPGCGDATADVLRISS